MPSRFLQTSGAPFLLEPPANHPAYGSAPRHADLYYNTLTRHVSFIPQSVIIWAGAITHVAVIVLVDPYLRTPASHRPQIDILALVMQVQAQPSVLLNLSTWEPVQGGPSSSTGSFISVRGFFVMLLASHGVIVFKRYVQHILHSIEGAEHSALPAGSTLSTKKKNRALRQLHCGFDSRSLPQLPHLKSKTRVTEVLCWRVL